MQASLTVAWMEKHANETLIYMRNTSEMPIFQPVYIKKKRRFLFWFIKAEEGRMAPVTQPNELHSKQSISRKVKQSEKCRFYVQFMSADGLAWERDLQTGKVRNLHRWRASL
ncbi:hypothetical protein BJF87_02300 [Gordonia sp. CNJ-863]|nr:hypothetical protein BJF87_02300 [Gordonia sp. CNJ-863]